MLRLDVVLRCISLCPCFNCSSSRSLRTSFPNMYTAPPVLKSTVANLNLGCESVGYIYKCAGGAECGGAQAAHTMFCHFFWIALGVVWIPIIALRRFVIHSVSGFCLHCRVVSGSSKQTTLPVALKSWMRNCSECLTLIFRFLPSAVFASFLVVDKGAAAPFPRRRSSLGVLLTHEILYRCMRRVLQRASLDVETRVDRPG